MRLNGFAKQRESQKSKSNAAVLSDAVNKSDLLSTIMTLVCIPNMLCSFSAYTQHSVHIYLVNVLIFNLAYFPTQSLKRPPCGGGENLNSLHFIVIFYIYSFSALVASLIILSIYTHVV